MKKAEEEELMEELLREQGFQFDFLLQIWVFLVFLSGVSAVLCAFIMQYVLAIINACIFLGAFLCFFAGAFRYYVLVVALLIYMAAGMVLESYYVVALMTDFYMCDSDSCRDWRLILFDINYFCVVFLAVTLFVVVKQSWIILEDHKRIVAAKVEFEMQKYIKEKEF